ncbi:MAG: shikimate kinase [Spongiibacteraceae bacterium]
MWRGMGKGKSAIVLIGMPGVGKSTIGRALAESLSLPFVDTDQLIVESQCCDLQEILDQRGYLALRSIEEEVILRGDFSHCVVATGGSAVYSAAAMAHLSTFGTLIFLDLDVSELQARLNNFSQRGIARPAGHSLADIYAERRPLYQRFADITVDTQGQCESELLSDLLQLLNNSV